MHKERQSSIGALFFPGVGVTATTKCTGAEQERDERNGSIAGSHGTQDRTSAGHALQAISEQQSSLDFACRFLRVPGLLSVTNAVLHLRQIRLHLEPHCCSRREGVC